MITIYTKTNCVFCDRAKTLLISKNIEHITISLDEGVHIGGVKVSRDELKTIAPLARSFPVIFQDDTYIGGYTDLVRMLSNTE